MADGRRKPTPQYDMQTLVSQQIEMNMCGD